MLLGLVAYQSFAQKIYTIETVPDPKSIPSSRFVSNPDGLLSEKTVTEINHLLAALEDSTTAQVAVVFVNSIGQVVPKDFAHDLFKKWGIGYQKKDNGLLILVVKDQRRIEFETGYGLEGVLPDAICHRIQTERMVPYAKKGDYDQALLEGVKAVVQIVQLPESKEEVYDESKYKAKAVPANPNYTIEDLVDVLFVYPFLFLIVAIIRGIVNSKNTTKKAIFKQIPLGYRLFRLFGLYFFIPVGIFFGILLFDNLLNDIAFYTCLYVYALLMFLERSRTSNRIFQKLYGSLNEPERWTHLDELYHHSFWKVLFFPIPFFQRRKDALKELDFIRNHPRTCKNDNEPLTKTNDKTRLNAYQKVEEDLKTVDYDVWECSNGHVEAIGYPRLGLTQYTLCPKCASRAYIRSEQTVRPATAEVEGKKMVVNECKACNYRQEIMVKIEKLTPRSSSSSHSSSSWSSSGSSSSGSSSSSSSSSGSSSSWGGGSSGGGGAGSNW